MKTWEDQPILEVAGSGLATARVAAVAGTHVICVTDSDGDASELRCEVMQSVNGEAPSVMVDDRVVVWTASPGSGVVLGRLGPPRPSESRPEAPHDIAPDSANDVRTESVPRELVLEASESVTLRVGEASITLRSDGKILIRGKDLVSHAKNVNRIKGGAVAIN